VILGWLVLGEPLTPRTAVAGAVIVFAVALIITARGRMRPPESRPETTTASGEAVPAPPARGPLAPRPTADPRRAAERSVVRD
jgi:hypothetical protein